MEKETKKSWDETWIADLLFFLPAVVLLVVALFIPNTGELVVFDELSKMLALLIVGLALLRLSFVYDSRVPTLLIVYAMGFGFICFGLGFSGTIKSAIDCYEGTGTSYFYEWSVSETKHPGEKYVLEGKDGTGRPRRYRISEEDYEWLSEMVSTNEEEPALELTLYTTIDRIVSIALDDRSASEDAPVEENTSSESEPVISTAG